MAVPNYYTSLTPFRELFGTGVPILTYHHVGPRPRGARIKGLFVARKLFATQVQEWAKANFAAPHYDNALPSLRSTGLPANIGTSQKAMLFSGKAADSKQPLFITFDDGFQDVFDNALPILEQHRFGSIQFLVADLLGKTNEWQQRIGDASHSLMDAGQVREWLAAGQEIGSHTCSHPKLSQIPISRAREEITASKKKLEDTFGRSINHFCYPYGDWNQAVRDLVEEAGYRTACTTQPGVNTPGTDPFAIKRFTARYRSRTWRNLFNWRS